MSEQMGRQTISNYGSRILSMWVTMDGWIHLQLLLYVDGRWGAKEIGLAPDELDRVNAVLRPR